MTYPVYFSLGTNIGNRESNIESAISYMEKAFGKKCKKRSDIIQTPSWGFDAPPFLNCAVLFELEESPQAVLEKCKKIEALMGRSDSPEYDSAGIRIYHSRIIDIDILFFGDCTMDTPTLKIPHPLISKRDFVKIPLRQIASCDLMRRFRDIIM